jgi:hypothetical protein
MQIKHFYGIGLHLITIKLCKDISKATFRVLYVCNSYKGLTFVAKCFKIDLKRRKAA